MNRIRLSLIVTCLSACGAAPPGSEAPAATIGRTIVIMNSDGEPTVKQDRITIEQHQRERLDHEALRSGTIVDGIGREAEAINYGQRDYSCAGSSLWMFDNAGNHPGPYPWDSNEICFFRNGHSGCSDLMSYTRNCDSYGCNHWAENWGPSAGGIVSWVQSYWAGADSGHIRNDAGWDWLFQSYQRLDGPFSAGYIGGPIYNTDLYWGRYVCF